ncbi:MAG: DUF2065 domain-containing protein [Magnetospirillum sp.]|nr:DUF2065 domain-containing protein [Magnetospirillum sp.]MBI3708017.1 DUF2065 domain-containing protein [Pseudomonadota bacterium]
MRDLLTALALTLVIEGLAWAAFPERMQRLVIQMLAAPPDLLRIIGLVAAAFGLGGVWLVRSALMAP